MPAYYTYVESEEHVNTWVNGGELPIKSARTYLSGSQEGSRTPDEVEIFRANYDPRPVMRSMGFHHATVTDFFCLGRDGRSLAVDHYRAEHGLVLCFSTDCSDHIAYKFGGRKFCVRIDDIATLKEHIDLQLGVQSQAGLCRYVAGNEERDHFTKGLDSAWQKEFRLFWPGIHEDCKWVTIPSGVGTAVAVNPDLHEVRPSISQPPSRLSKCSCGSGLRFKACHGKLI